MIGLPAVTGNALLDAAFYISSTLIVLFVAGFIAWHLRDLWRFRNEDGSETSTAIASAAAADLAEPVAVSQAKAYAAAAESGSKLTEFERITRKAEGGAA